jgi:amino acid transporter
VTTSTSYILISILVFLIVAVLVFFISHNRQENHLTPMAGLAFGFIVAGVMFGENCVIGYGLMGIGLIISVVDIIRGSRKK